MRAMILRSYNQRVELGDIPVPEIGPGDVLVRMKACGMCRTDVKIWSGQFPPSIIQLPLVMGHEPAGVVESVGERVSGLQVGDRVVCHFYVTCGNCAWCANGEETICPSVKRLGFEANGGYAEFIRVPARNVFKIGDMPFEQACILPDAVATTLRALRAHGQVRVGEDVLIIGVGGLGVHAVQVARHAGARVIAADISDERLAFARKYGAHEVIDAHGDPLPEIARITDGRGVDIVVDIVGTPESMAWGLHSLRRGGRFVLVGYSPATPFPLESMLMHLNEWKIFGTRCSSRTELADSIRLVNSGAVVPVVSRVYPLEELNEALREVAAGRVLGRTVIRIS